jgi:hypothetical protein
MLRRQFLGRVGSAIAGAMLAKAGLTYCAPQETITVVSEQLVYTTYSYSGWYEMYANVIIASPAQCAAIERLTSSSYILTPDAPRRTYGLKELC